MTYIVIPSLIKRPILFYDHPPYGAVFILAKLQEGKPKWQWKLSFAETTAVSQRNCQRQLLFELSPFPDIKTTVTLIFGQESAIIYKTYRGWLIMNETIIPIIIGGIIAIIPNLILIWNYEKTRRHEMRMKSVDKKHEAISNFLMNCGRTTDETPSDDKDLKELFANGALLRVYLKEDVAKAVSDFLDVIEEDMDIEDEDYQEYQEEYQGKYEIMIRALSNELDS